MLLRAENFLMKMGKMYLLIAMLRFRPASLRSTLRQTGCVILSLLKMLKATILLGIHESLPQNAGGGG